MASACHRVRPYTWRPNMLPGCVLWLRADLGITLGTGVSAWADKSGKGNTVSQSTGAAQPTYTASDANFAGKASLSFNPAAAQLLAGAFASLNGAAGATAIVVCKLATSDATNRMALSTDTTSLQLQAFNGNRYTYAGAGNYVSGANASTSPLVWESVFDGSQVGNLARLLHLVNGVSIASASAGAVPAALGTSTTVRVGAASDGSSQWTGQIAEIAVYSVALSASNRLRVRRRTGARAGITVS